MRFTRRRFARAASSAFAAAGRGLREAAWTVAPAWCARQQSARHARAIRERGHKALMAHFEGADNDRLRGDSWLKSRLSPDSALEEDLETLRENSRELYHNFGWITGAVEHRVDNAIGCGMRAQARIRETAGVITEADARELNTRLEELFQRWSRRASRVLQSLPQVQRLAERLWLRDGEVFLVFSDVGSADKPVPLDVSIVAAERCETPPEFVLDPLVRMGIRFRQNGEIAGYYLRDTHPHDTVDNTPTYRFYPAWRVRHLFEPLSEGQHRGLPWCFSVLTDAKDFKDYKEAVVIAAQTQACATMVINTSDSAGAAAANPELNFSPGKALFVNNADQIAAFNPSQPTTTFDMFGQWNMLGIAAGLNYPFGWLVRDRRRATFSAGRLDEIDGKTPLRCDQQMHREVWLIPLWERFVAECVVLGEVDIDPSLYNEFPWVFNAVRWIGPGRPWIDPTKEVTAATIAVNENLSTKSEVLGGTGFDFEETLEQRRFERELEAEFGVVPPSQQAGGAVGKDSPPPDDEEDEEEDDEEDGRQKKRARAYA